jgi:pyridoxal phosphate enzyme (YggS family)
MKNKFIETRAKRLLRTLPLGVTMVAAAKSRTPEEVQAAIRGGVTCVGHNYVQEAERMIRAVGYPVQWHMIGHLQRNKVKKAVQLFDMIETVDSWRLALKLDRHCAAMGKVMPILIEINSGRETSKTGVLPEVVDDLVGRISQLQNIQLKGLMTMGPRFGNPEDARSYFRATREALECLLALNFPNMTLDTLSMGMSNSYMVAIEEGANMVRIGTKLFGDWPSREGLLR